MCIRIGVYIYIYIYIHIYICKSYNTCIHVSYDVFSNQTIFVRKTSAREMAPTRYDSESHFTRDAAHEM